MTVKSRIVRRACRAVLVALIAVVLSAVSAVQAQQPPQPDMSGLWKNADTTMRITVQKDDIRGEFVEVGPAAANLGFKPKEVSLAARRRGPFLFGEQVIRYGTSQQCYKEGRKIPVIGRLTPDGANLALHHYTVFIGPECKDTGEYTLIQTLWRRVGQ
jgi:hypothetical protein